MWGAGGFAASWICVGIDEMRRLLGLLKGERMGGGAGVRLACCGWVAATFFTSYLTHMFAWRWEDLYERAGRGGRRGATGREAAPAGRD